MKAQCKRCRWHAVGELPALVELATDHLVSDHVAGLLRSSNHEQWIIDGVELSEPPDPYQAPLFEFRPWPSVMLKVDRAFWQGVRAW